jgi:TRAP-type C4-dicarboxylate transport system permease small subunit
VVRRVLAVVDRALEDVAAALLLALAVVTIAQVFSRYLLAVSLVWVEEAGRFLFTWVIWLGAAVGVRRGQHIAFTFLTERLPPRARALLGSVVDLLIIAFLALLVVQGWEVAASVAATSYIAIPWLSVRYAYLVTVVMGGFMLLAQVAVLVARWRPTPGGAPQA